MHQIISLKNLAVLRCAADVCLRPDVLHMMMESDSVCPCCVRNVWINVYSKVLGPAVFGLKIPLSLQEDLLDHTSPILIKLMYFIIYHENIFHVKRAKMIRCLDSSVLTSEGFVDHTKLGAKLVGDEQLSDIIKYRLSVFYFVEGVIIDNTSCVENFIYFKLWKGLPKEKRQCLLNERSIGLVRIITHLLHSVGKINKKFSQRQLVKIFRASVRSGSILAVTYSWRNLKDSHRSGLLVPTCLSVLSLIADNDKICFQSNLQLVQHLAPNDFYLDVLCFLISQMDEIEQEEFVRKDVTQNGYARSVEYLTRTPYQKRLLQVAASIKKLLPRQDFPHSLLDIANNLGPKCMYSTNALPENTGTDYYSRKLRECWIQSDDEHKRSFFSDGSIPESVLAAIIRRFNFTYLDEENFKMILEDATLEEKLNVLHGCGLTICFLAYLEKRYSLALWFVKTCCPDEGTLISFTLKFFTPRVLEITYESLVQMMEFVDLLLKEYFHTEQEISDFKISLSSSNQEFIFFNLINKDWQAFVHFMEWCFDTEEKLLAFKKQFVIDFSKVCQMLIFNSRWPEVELFLTWIFSTEKEIEVYKRFVLFPAFGLSTILNFIKSASFEQAETCLLWFGLSETEIRKLKHESLLNCNKITSILTTLLFVNTENHEGSNEEAVTLQDENSSDEENSELEEEYDPENDSAAKCIETCGGRLQAVELIVRWLLTDLRVTLLYRRMFHEACADLSFHEGVNKPLRLAIFDQIVQQHLLDLTAQEN